MLNTVQFQGNIVRDPEFAETRGDTDILNFTVAHSRKYKNKEDTSFVDCTAYGTTAENIAKFFWKGDPILVQGRLCQNTWENREGDKRSKVFITVEMFHFAGPTGDRNGGRSSDRGRDRDDNRGRNQGRGRDRDSGRGRDRDDRGRSQDRGRDRDQGSQQRPYDEDVPF